MDKKNNSKRNLLIIGVIIALAFGWVTLYLVNQVQADPGAVCEGYQAKIYGSGEFPEEIYHGVAYIRFFSNAEEGKGVQWIATPDIDITDVCVKIGGDGGGTIYTYPGVLFSGTLNDGLFSNGYDVSHIAFNFTGDKGDITPTPTDEEKEETPTPTVETPTPTVETPTETPTVETPTETPTIETPTETPTIETPTETPTVETPTPTVETPTPTPTVETPSPTPTATDEPSGASVAARPTTTLWQSFIQWLCQIGINLGGCW